jgi:hypothetical protein
MKITSIKINVVLAISFDKAVLTATLVKVVLIVTMKI